VWCCPRLSHYRSHSLALLCSHARVGYMKHYNMWSERYQSDFGHEPGLLAKWRFPQARCDQTDLCRVYHLKRHSSSADEEMNKVPTYLGECMDKLLAQGEVVMWLKLLTLHWSVFSEEY
jgi:hypothetical protein